MDGSITFSDENVINSKQNLFPINLMEFMAIVKIFLISYTAP